MSSSHQVSTHDILMKCHREIHLSDLIRAHEGNPDYHDDDPTKIHWAKFNMMARFIDTIVQCQKGCRESGEYDRFQDRHEIRKLFLTDREDALMDYEVRDFRALYRRDC